MTLIMIGRFCRSCKKKDFVLKTNESTFNENWVTSVIFVTLCKKVCLNQMNKNRASSDTFKKSFVSHLCEFNCIVNLVSSVNGSRCKALFEDMWIQLTR